MNTDKLSNRLETVAKYVQNGAKIADIGSDHAYLPCFLAKKGTISLAIAGEVVEGPFKSAARNVQSEGLADIVSVRLGDGLEVIEPGEVDCITIAGMGGTLIATILDKGKEKLQKVMRLVLQPNISASSIRKWLLDHQWELIAEEILEEDGKIYEVLAAEKGDPYKPYGNTQLELELLVGPFLLKTKDETFKKKWRMEKENWKRIYSQLEGATSSEETELKKQELLEKIKMVEEALGDENSERS
ncbi:tRNA (adenine(22)-N(1))-methyltransferase TrmK [Neobacillus niacini]|uniref:tRNA (adenine(22)-N(1))-methyltransferase n=1 Tax=Neobacillus niacini TaxID=86668 RepID=UPI002860E28F|nr:tRNA (adenine(22)-N(1))-methyltransferase TrmK [Neobacillus niacini]MDR7000438.1 tRNA (adenine22-N1)-methyltransferase [Neobacillus niacini]